MYNRKDTDNLTISTMWEIAIANTIKIWQYIAHKPHEYSLGCFCVWANMEKNGYGVVYNFSIFRENYSNMVPI